MSNKEIKVEGIFTFEQQNMFELDSNFKKFLTLSFFDQLKSNSKFDTKDLIDDLIFNTKNIFREFKKYKSILLAGEVQSGKTNNIITSTTFALDNDFDCVIIIGGNTNLLLEQLNDRIKHLSNYPYEVLFYDYKKPKTSLELLKRENKKVIMNILKNVKHFTNIEYQLKNITKDFKTLIIDDECDYMSLNTTKSVGERSKIYTYLTSILENSNTKYLGVTATPYANILNNYSNSIVPESIIKLKVSKNYTGLNFFHKNNIYNVFAKDKWEQIDSNNEDDKYLDELYMFVSHYAITSSFINKYANLNINAIINIDVKAEEHKNLELCLKKAINLLHKNFVKNINLDYINLLIDKYNKIKPFRKEDVINFSTSAEIVILDNKTKNKIIENKNAIYIGGNLVSRGLTFENLITEIMLNVRKKMQPIDILLQRARWFGYRNWFIKELNIEFWKLMQIFISPYVKDSLDEAYEVNKLLYNKLLNQSVNENIFSIKESLSILKDNLKFIKYSDKE